MQFSFRDSVEPVYRQFVDLLLTPPSREVEPPQQNLQKAREVLEALQVTQLQNFLQQACEEKRLEIDRIIDRTYATVTCDRQPNLRKGHSKYRMFELLNQVIGQ